MHTWHLSCPVFRNSEKYTPQSGVCVMLHSYDAYEVVLGWIISLSQETLCFFMSNFSLKEELVLIQTR